MEKLEEQLLKYINGLLEERKKLLQSGWEELSENVKKALDGFALHLNVDFAPLSPEHLKDILPLMETSGKSREEEALMPIIHAGIRGLRQENSQGRLITYLLNTLSKLVSRAALFVVKEDKLIGWDGRGFENLTELDFRKMIIPFPSESVFSRVVKEGGIYQGSFPKLKGDRRVITFLGGEPVEVILIPIIVRGKVSGVIYADEWPEKTRIRNPEAIEVLVDFAEAMVELLPVRNKYPTKPKGKVKVEEEAVPSESSEISMGDTTKREVSFKSFGVSPSLGEEDTRPGVVAEGMDTREIEAEELEVSAPSSDTSPTPTSWGENVEVEEVEEVEEMEELEIEEVEQKKEPEVPEELSEEERALYESARRKARVLVSDLILYNREKIEKGKLKGNIYEELKDEIDLAIEIYRKKVGGKVNKDFLYEELLNKLADGNPALLKGYPGV